MQVSTTSPLCHKGDIAFLRQDENYELWYNLTPEQMLRINAGLFGATKDALLDALLRVNNFKETRIGDLSGGQRSIYTLCSALLLKPRVIVLDEALSKLDSMSSLEVMEVLHDIATELGCIIILSIHQPRSELMRFFTKLIILSSGTLAVNAPISALAGALNMSNGKSTDTMIDAIIHQILSSNSRLDPQDALHRQLSSGDLDESTTVSETNTNKPTSYHSLLRETIFLSVRLAGAFGGEYGELLMSPMCCCVMAYLLGFDDGLPSQLIFLVSLLIGIPVVVYHHKVLAMCYIWHAHKFELADKRYHWLSFLMATHLSLLCMPIGGVMLSVIIAYLVLQWSNDTILIQFIFVALYLLLSQACGRVLALVYDGSYSSFSKGYYVVLMLGSFFSGTLTSISNFSGVLRIPMYLSHNFWAISGAVLHQLNKGHQLGEDPCTNYISCLVNNKAYMASFFGYSQVTTTMLSFIVLVVALCITLCMEMVYLRHRLKKFAKYTQVKGNDFSAEKDMVSEEKSVSCDPIQHFELSSHGSIEHDEAI